MAYRLSVVVATKNEEKHLPALLESVRWADEIVVVDMFSSDRTIEIARQYTDKVYQHDSFRETGSLVPEPIAVNKNLGFEKAGGDWILELDADERLTPEVTSEIKAVLGADDVLYDGFMMHRLNYFFGSLVQHGGWQHDRHIRFFRKGAACWPIDVVHRPHIFEGRLGYLKSPFVHYMCATLSDFIRKMELYTSQEAAHLSSCGRPFSLRTMMLGSAYQFFKRYVLLQGFRDGVPGLIMCGAYTSYSFFLHAKLWEMSKRAEER